MPTQLIKKYIEEFARWLRNQKDYLGPETPASMRRQQLEMLMPGFSERARKAREKYRTILRGA